MKRIAEITIKAIAVIAVGLVVPIGVGLWMNHNMSPELPLPLNVVMGYGVWAGIVFVLCCLVMVVVWSVQMAWKWIWEQ